MVTQYEQELSKAKLKEKREVAKITAELHQMEIQRNAVRSEVSQLNEKQRFQQDRIAEKERTIAA